MFRPFFAFVGIIFGALASYANAAVLLTADTTDPSAVVISTTGLAAGQEVIVTNSQQRQVRLELLISPAPGGGNQPLTESLISLEFNDDTELLRTSFVQGSGDLLLLAGAGPGFTIAEDDPVFLGSITIDLSAFASSFQAPGFVGDLTYFNGANVITLGEYQVVPEPSAGLLMLLCAGPLLSRRRLLTNRSRGTDKVTVTSAT